MQLHERSCCGFRLSPKLPTRRDEGSSSRCSRRKREAQSCQPISTAVHKYSLTPTAARKSTKTIKSTRPTIRRRTRRIQWKTSPVEKGRFRLAEKDCVRNCLNVYNSSLLKYNPWLNQHRTRSTPQHGRGKDARCASRLEDQAP